MSYYVGARTGRGIFVEFVDDRGRRHPLPHLVKHSRDGFDWGCSGSGPADLARSLVGHALGTPDPDPEICQRIEWDIVARLPWHQWRIRAEELRAAIERAQDAIRALDRARDLVRAIRQARRKDDE